MNKLFLKLGLFSVFLSVLTGCSTVQLTYEYTPNANDPVIEFKSDYELHTFFRVNTKAPNENQCSDYDLAGFLLFKDSFTLYDKPNTESHIQVPANKEVAIRAMHYTSDPGFTSSCGPITTLFTPEAGKEYIYKMNQSGKRCFVTIEEKNDPDVEVKRQILGACKK